MLAARRTFRIAASCCLQRRPASSAKKPHAPEETTADVPDAEDLLQRFEALRSELRSGLTHFVDKLQTPPSGLDTAGRRRARRLAREAKAAFDVADAARSGSYVPSRPYDPDVLSALADELTSAEVGRNVGGSNAKSKKPLESEQSETQPFWIPPHAASPRERRRRAAEARLTGAAGAQLRSDVNRAGALLTSYAQKAGGAGAGAAGGLEGLWGGSGPGSTGASRKGGGSIDPAILGRDPTPQQLAEAEEFLASTGMGGPLGELLGRRPGNEGGAGGLPNVDDANASTAGSSSGPERLAKKRSSTRVVDSRNLSSSGGGGGGGGFVTFARAEDGGGRLVSGAAPLPPTHHLQKAPFAGRRPAPAGAPEAAAQPRPASLHTMCTALGIDPYNVTPAALGVGSSSSSKGDAAAWEEALASVDLEEEGGSLPAHHARTGALLTDRERRGIALVRAVLAYFPQYEAAAAAAGADAGPDVAPWTQLTGRGLSVESVLRAAGLTPADLAGSAEEGVAGAAEEARIRARIHAALMAVASSRE